MGALNRATDSGVATLPDVDRMATAIAAEIGAYDAPAHAPEEGERWARARALLAEIVTDARRVREDLAAARVVDARKLLDSHLRPRASEADGELWQSRGLRRLRRDPLSRHVHVLAESAERLRSRRERPGSRQRRQSPREGHACRRRLAGNERIARQAAEAPVLGPRSCG